MPHPPPKRWPLIACGWRCSTPGTSAIFSVRVIYNMPRAVVRSRWLASLIRHLSHFFIAIYRSPQGLCGVFCLTEAAYLSLHIFGLSTRLCSMRCATSSPSSNRSRRLQRARRPPADTSGSGVAASVHCGGTEQIRPSAKRSSQRLPARLPRFAMHTPPCPEYG